MVRPDYQLFVALVSGEHAMHGFANRDLRAKLSDQLRDDPKQQRLDAGQVRYVRLSINAACETRALRGRTADGSSLIPIGPPIEGDPRRALENAEVMKTIRG